MSSISTFDQAAEKLVYAKTILEVWTVHKQCMASYGFDRLFYVSSVDKVGKGWGDSADWVLLTNYDREIVDVFVGEELYKQTSRAPYVEGQSAVSWGDGYAAKDLSELSAADRKHAELCKKWGIESGYTLRFPKTAKNHIGIIGLCAQKGVSQTEVDALWQQKGQEIQTLNNLMNLRITSLPHGGQRTPLTQRQREVLEWVADGKTSRDIALLMNLSLSTIEKHLRLAREALNAETTANAVSKAASYNQLFLLNQSK
ncbi:autoinducer binding domain-containing protein [Shimia thalassica]|uniref:helix-turn-helix transcriptional regulator n=1 Tax=Shimia thalassica TaxID=1715693 RepID=UPI001C08C8FF|nr:LuxR family transcriptional regulator [Shimia thalassica]MBU2943348.1 LuxR family transcriptional regulator [Shimia thalassica]MDO6501417.1 autoinducer binding domain-containing protein [Shimia thalassica]